MINTCLSCEVETSNPKFCSSSCSATYNNKLRKSKTCLNCEEAIPKINKYCNNTCQHEYERKLKVKDLLEGKFIGKVLKAHTGSWAKTYLLGLFNYQCSSCGIGEEWNGSKLILELDHIDGKAYNNTIENLRILCPNCHSQTDNYKAKNKSSDRIDRYK